MRADPERGGIRCQDQALRHSLQSKQQLLHFPSSKALPVRRCTSSIWNVALVFQQEVLQIGLTVISLSRELCPIGQISEEWHRTTKLFE